VFIIEPHGRSFHSHQDANSSTLGASNAITFVIPLVSPHVDDA
jgi:hypothetical protein